MKTIDLTVKTWWDRVNGNTYFSGHIVIDYGMETEKTILMPFQYGYGTHSEWMAKTALQEAGFIPRDEDAGLYMHCEKNKIIYRYNKQEGCLLRDVKAFGKVIA